MTNRSQRRLGPRWVASLVTVTVAALAWSADASAMTVGGACTLKVAVDAVNAQDNTTACGSAVIGGTTPISVPAGTYVLNGELKINASRSASIVGADPANPSATTIDANFVSRVFEVASGGDLSLSAVKITRGRTLTGISGTTQSPYGNSAADGGGILNAGSLSLDHALLTGNATGAGGNGATAPDRYGRPGGYGGNGGGIASTGALSLTASTISGNNTGAGGDGAPGGDGELGNGHNPSGAGGGDGGSAGGGGGIYVGGGGATVTTSTISGNFTGRAGKGGNGGRGVGYATGQPQGDGGDGGYGGNNGRQYTLQGENNTEQSAAGGGGGILSFGKVTMTNSTLSGNSTGAGGNGGGAGISGPSSNNMYFGNQSGGLGGGGGAGAGLLSLGNGSGASLTNVTISGNHAGTGGTGGPPPQSGTRRPGQGGFGGEGGGIWAAGFNGSDAVYLDHVTMAGNSAGAGGTAADNFVGADGVGGAIRTGGRYSPSTSARGVYVKNSIIAGNGVPNCSQYYPPDNYVDIEDQGNNLRYQVVAVGQPADNSCPGTAADPKLGSLQNNGGPTNTLLPALGSGAINAGTCDVATDQRLYPRPVSGCDIGAVEFGATPSGGGGTTPTQTSLSSPKNPSTAPEFVNLVATVSPSPSGGTVQFKDGSTVISGCGAVPVGGSGSATCPYQIGLSGTHPIVAAYSGTTSFGASTSNTVTQVVKPGGSTGNRKPTPGPTKPVVLAPHNSALPAIAGTTTSGKTLTASRGTWTGTAPLAYAYGWQRCAATCVPIGGATGATYNLKTADVGKTIRVVVTASNTAGHVPATSAARGPVAPSTAKIKGFLTDVLSPSGKAGKIGALLKAGGFKFSATAPSAGTLTLSWYQVPKGAKAVSAKKKKKAKKPVLVATVKTTVKKAGKVKPKIKLTAKGKKLLKHTKKIKLTAKQTFKPKGGKATVVRKPIKLKR